MTRRRLLEALAIALAGASQTRCTLYYGRRIIPEKKKQLMTQDSGTLQHTWTDVKALRMHNSFDEIYMMLFSHGELAAT